MLAAAILTVILVIPFVAGMIMVVLPELDEVVKQNHGIVHAIIFTRCCCLCVGLPLYIFTIWMIVVTTFSPDGAYEVMELMCPDDFGCTQFMSFGLYRHNKEACLAPFDRCTPEDLDARAGIQPLELKFDLGHYGEEPEELELNFFTSNFSDSDISGNSLPAGFDVDALDDVEGAEVTVACVVSVGDKCARFSMESDSIKQFWSGSCSFNISQSNIDEADYDCNLFIVQYYYPNVLLALLICVLILVPYCVVLIIQIKAQCLKVIPCRDPKVITYSQGAGRGNQTTGAPVTRHGPGTYYEEDNERRSKSRTFSRLDVCLLVSMVPAMVSIGWLMVRSAGRISILLLVFTFLILLLLLVLKLIVFKIRQFGRISHMKKTNGAKDYREYS